MSDGSTPNLKAMVSLVLLISWEIWNKENSCVFRNKHATSLVILENVRKEASLRVITVVECLSEIVPGRV
jgi:hypothetical protein